MAIETLTKFTGSGITIFKIIYDKVTNNKEQKRNAILALQNAVNSTRIFLQDNLKDKNNYQPNKELSELWLVAFKEIHPIDVDLADRLRHKSKFWTNPQRWMEEPSSMELVPKLLELEDYADSLLVQMK